jgi:hypothetical protein
MNATMQKLKIIRDRLLSLRDWRKGRVGLARIREHPFTEPAQEEHCLDAMRSWRNPADRTRTRHTLLEDDPPSG